MRRISRSLLGGFVKPTTSRLAAGLDPRLSSSVVWCQQQRWVVIEASVTPNPDSLRFFSMELSFLPPGTNLDLPNDGHSYKSPLAAGLFSLNGVRSLYFADEWISVTKESYSDWGELEPMVKEVMSSFSESGQNILADNVEQTLKRDDDDTEPSTEDDEVVLAIKELIASRIRPMVRQDGGNVRYIGIDDGTVYVMLEGACKTCPSSGMTLKNGIERMLMHWIPEVVEVLEVDEDFAYDFKRQQEEEKAKGAAILAAEAEAAAAAATKDGEAGTAAPASSNAAEKSKRNGDV